MKARYLMIGGFLGVGKTTAVAKLARRLSAQGLRVGLITNDQGKNLVDTALLRSQGFATEEIPGGASAAGSTRSWRRRKNSPRAPARRCSLPNPWGVAPTSPPP